MSVKPAAVSMAVVDGALAAAILFGLIVNAVAGWWWADIAAGVVLILYGLHEGRTHLRQAAAPQ
jgi:divalent metal cation (Fe/Co/Zn/Cd) transporter